MLLRVFGFSRGSEQSLQDSKQRVENRGLPGPDLVTVARMLSWSGLLVEGGVGVAHTIPGHRAYLLRHYALMAFIAITYFLLPVAGFAFVLTILGFAQCERSDDLMRLRYLALFGFIHLTLVPWRSILYG